MYRAHEVLGRQRDALYARSSVVDLVGTFAEQCVTDALGDLAQNTTMVTLDSKNCVWHKPSFPNDLSIFTGDLAADWQLMRVLGPQLKQSPGAFTVWTSLSNAQNIGFRAQITVNN